MLAVFDCVIVFFHDGEPQAFAKFQASARSTVVDGRHADLRHMRPPHSGSVLPAGGPRRRGTSMRRRARRNVWSMGRSGVAVRRRSLPLLLLAADGVRPQRRPLRLVQRSTSPTHMSTFVPTNRTGKTRRLVEIPAHTGRKDCAKKTSCMCRGGLRSPPGYLALAGRWAGWSGVLGGRHVKCSNDLTR